MLLNGTCKRKYDIHVKYNSHTIQNMQVKGSTPVHCQKCPLGQWSNQGQLPSWSVKKRTCKQRGSRLIWPLVYSPVLVCLSDSCTQLGSDHASVEFLSSHPPHGEQAARRGRYNSAFCLHHVPAVSNYGNPISKLNTIGGLLTHL